MKNKNLLEIHIAVLFFGLAGLFGKLILLPALIIVLGRVIFAAIFLALLSLYLKQNIKLNQKKDYLYLFILGIILALHWWTFFQAIRVSTVAVGLLTYSTFPIFVTFLEPYFFKEKIKRSDIFLALITFLGVILVIPRFEIANNITQGAVWGIASGFTFAVLSILNREYVKKYSSLVIAFYQDSAAAIVLLPFLFLMEFTVTLKDILLLALLGIGFTAIAHTLFIKGLTNVKAQTASIIACLEPVYGIVIAIFLLGEVPGLRIISGGMLILSVTIYATIKQKKINFY
ncbi:DMT family transporter [Acidobacteriota bacterium]